MPVSYTTIGHIYANIAGDHRYGTTIDVRKAEDGGVAIVLVDTHPVGGMDGPGGTYTDPGKIVQSWEPGKATPAALIEALKVAFKQDGGIVATYGKPTKRFRWTNPDGTEAIGLSAALAKAALASR